MLSALLMVDVHMITTVNQALEGLVSNQHIRALVMCQALCQELDIVPLNSDNNYMK